MTRHCLYQSVRHAYPIAITIASAALLGPLLASSLAQAAGTYTWVGSSINWIQPTSWSPPTVPGSGDVAAFTGSFSLSPSMSGSSPLGQFHVLGALSKSFTTTAFANGGLTLYGDNAGTDILIDYNNSPNVGVTFGGDGSLALGGSQSSPSCINNNTNGFGAGQNSLIVAWRAPLGGKMLTLAGGGNTLFSAVISGSGGLIVNGPGALTLSGSNTYSDGTALFGGLLNLSSAASIGTGVWTINGGTLDNTRGTPMTLSNNPQTWNGDFTFLGTSNLGLGSGTVNLANPVRLTVNSSALTVGGAISGSGGLTKAGTGTLVLAGNNSYGGATTVASGTLQMAQNDAIPTNTALAVNGLLDLNTYSATVDGLSGGGTIVTFAGGSPLLTVGNAGGSGTFSGVISGKVALAKTGSGTLILSGSNTHFGTTLSAGLLGFNNAAAIGTGLFSINGGTLDNSSGAAITNANNNAQGWNGDFTFLGTNNLNLGSGAVNLPNSVNVTTIASTLTVGGAISGPGSLTKSGSGQLVLSGNNTYSGATTVAGGNLQLGRNAALPASTGLTVDGMLDMNTYSAAVDSLNGGGTITSNGGTPLLTVGNAGGSGNFSGTITGPIALAKTGAGALTLSGSSSYSGGTTVSQGTLNITGAIGGGTVLINGGAVLAGSGTVQSSITGNAGSAIVATGNLALGDSTSYTGFNHAGTLMVGANLVTLKSAGFANLGVLTTVSGGTLAAPNGVAIPLGGNLVGSGAVQGKVAAGYGSTINATGNLTLGDSNSFNGFYSNGELYTNANAVTLNAKSTSINKNAAVLGALTEIENGTLLAPNGFLLGSGNTLVSNTGGYVSNLSAGSGSSASRFLNQGMVQGPDGSTDAWLEFDLPFKGSTGQSGGNLYFKGGYSPGNSPGVNTQNGNTRLGGSNEFDIGGPTPGSGSGHYSQLNLIGNLTLDPGTTLYLAPWEGYVPTGSEQFTFLTWTGTLSGTASLAPDPWYTSQGIHFTTEWTADGLVLTAVPEPSALALAGVGAIALLGCLRRRRR